MLVMNKTFLGSKNENGKKGKHPRIANLILGNTHGPYMSKNDLHSHQNRESEFIKFLWELLEKIRPL